ncbi:MAG: mobile mystery protein B [Balneolia bacterium]|nr:mobile mystery protein B [Balneolia bacterium]
MGLDLNYIYGQTPLDEDEKEGLLIPTIATRTELDEFEQQNIEDAVQWILERSFKTDKILSENFIRSLHKKMFGEVWSWAGTFRKTNKNLGVDKWQIPAALKNLCDDSHFWIKNETFPPDEIAVRFKHRVVSIHCFPNGNGRHSRIMADVIAHNVFGRPMFSWGAGNIIEEGGTRRKYIEAIQLADEGSYEELLKFARI